MANKGKGSVRKPAGKFPHLQKKLKKAATTGRRMRTKQGR